MSVRRRDLEQGLIRAERIIALTERSLPHGAEAEHERVLAAHRAGREVEPRLAYRPAPELDGLRRWLESVAETVASLDEWGGLYAARAAELALEAELCQHLGARDFAVFAGRRHPVDAGPNGARAERWARAWCAESGAYGREQVTSASDDERDPRSLISAMRRAVGAARLPYRVLVRRGLLTAAATGDGVILVRGGARHDAREVSRIVAHEIEGHALPRARAKRETLGLFALGTARGSDDEEGRALVIEERVGGMTRTRRAELGRRHLAALAVRDGASFVEVVRVARGAGADVDEAVALAFRVTRGGGLAREIVYLPALARVASAFAADPDAERWLERGRIAVEAVPKLRRLGAPPEWLGRRAA